MRAFDSSVRLRRPLGPLVAALCLALQLWSCGGSGEVTTAPDPRIACPSLDAQLEGLYELVETRQLDALAATLGTLHPDLQGDLVVTLLRLVAGFEPGTFAALGELSEAAAGSTSLVATLADALDFIAETSPAAPYPDALGALATLVKTCEGPPALGLLRDVLGDPSILDAVTAALDAFDLGEQIGSINVDGSKGRDAIKALARNLLVAAQRPDFDVTRLVDLLALIVDVDAEPYAGLVGALNKLLGQGPNLTALQGLLGCVQEADANLALVELLLDVVLDGPLALGSDRPEEGAPAAEGSPFIPDSVLGPLDTVLAFLIDDASARRTLADVVVVSVTAPTVADVMGDLASLLRADLLGDLITTLSNLATRTCPERIAAGGLEP